MPEKCRTVSGKEPVQHMRDSSLVGFIGLCVITQSPPERQA